MELSYRRIWHLHVRGVCAPEVPDASSACPSEKRLNVDSRRYGCSAVRLAIRPRRRRQEVAACRRLGRRSVVPELVAESGNAPPETGNGPLPRTAVSSAL